MDEPDPDQRRPLPSGRPDFLPPEPRPVAWPWLPGPAPASGPGAGGPRRWPAVVAAVAATLLLVAVAAVFVLPAVAGRDPDSATPVLGGPPSSPGLFSPYPGIGPTSLPADPFATPEPFGSSMPSAPGPSDALPRVQPGDPTPRSGSPSPDPGRSVGPPGDGTTGSSTPAPQPAFTPPADASPLPDGRPSVPAGASIGAIAQATLPGVVQLVSTATGSGDGTASPAADSSGSGIVVRDSGSGVGLVLTNNHVVADVVAGRAELKAVFPDGQRTSARVVGTSPSYDTAVVEVTGARSLRPVPLGRSAGVAIGDPVIAIGAPLGLTGTVTDGIVSALDRPVALGDDGSGSAQTFVSALQTNAAINPGNSGGPLIDARGMVIGMNTAIASLGGSAGEQSGSIGLGFSLPVDDVRTIADQILRAGQARYPVLGASVDTSAGTADAGATLRTVDAGGPADHAGLVAGDVVVEVDGRPVSDGEAFVVAIRQRTPGQTVSLVVQRGTSRRTVSLTLDGRAG